MKFKNKRTGEIKDWDFGNWYQTILNPENKEKYECNLNDFIDRTVKFREEWEDYEEPIQVYIEGIQNVHMGGCRVYIDYASAQEAEKAVRKLKAFANLRKRGLKFNGWDEADRGMVGEFAIYCDALELDGIERELEIVFGREEL